MPTLYKIRLQIVAAAEDDGSNAPSITASQFGNKLATLNKIYSKASLKFEYDASKDFVLINSSLLSRDFTLLEEPNLPGGKWDHDPTRDVQSHQQARDALARSFTGKLVIFFHNRVQIKKETGAEVWYLAPKNGGSSAWYAYYVDMSPSSGANDLAHEIGHYLQIPHPFGSSPATVSAAAQVIKDYVEAGSPAKDGLLALDGDRDWVLDTPADASLTIFKSLDLDPCGQVGEIQIPVTFSNGAKQTYTLAPDRSLVMSYFKGCSGDKTISVQQARRVRDSMELRQRRDLISSKASFGYQIVQGASSSAGEVSELSAALVHSGWVATAVRDGSHELKLIVWAVNSGGSKISRLGTGEGGKVSAVSVCSLGLNMLATPVVSASGSLEVIAWRVNNLGKPQRLGEASKAGNITDVASAYITRNHLVTASRLLNGDLRMDVWYIPANGAVSHITSANAGKVNAGIPNFATPGLAVCEVGNASAATSVRDASGKLKTILWRYDASAKKLLRIGDAALSLSPVGPIDVCSPGRENAVAAYQNKQGNLALLGYRFPEDGLTILAEGSAEAGSIDATTSEAVSVCRLGTELAVTGVRAGVGKLKLILWQVSPLVEGIGRLDDFTSQESYSRLSIVQTGIRQFVTATRDAGGDLKLIAWQVKFLAGKAISPAKIAARKLPLDAASGGDCDVEDELVLVKVGKN
jgi:hypothetical protein